MTWWASHSKIRFRSRVLPPLAQGDDVVDVGAPGVAAGELAPVLVTFADGAAQRGGGAAVAAADVEQGAVVVVQHPADTVAWQARAWAAAG